MTTAALAVAALAVAGCADNDKSGGHGKGKGGKVSSAEQACLRDVKAYTGATKAEILSSEFSEAGTYVKVGIGEHLHEHAWKCIGYRDGTTDGIESLVDEGRA